MPGDGVDVAMASPVATESRPRAALTGQLALRAWQAAGVIALLVFTLHVCFHVGGPASGSFYNWVYTTCLFLPTAGCVARAALVREERARGEAIFPFAGAELEVDVALGDWVREHGDSRVGWMT